MTVTRKGYSCEMLMVVKTVKPAPNDTVDINVLNSSALMLEIPNS